MRYTRCHSICNDAWHHTSSKSSRCSFSHYQSNTFVLLNISCLHSSNKRHLVMVGLVARVVTVARVAWVVTVVPELVLGLELAGLDKVLSRP